MHNEWYADRIDNVMKNLTLDAMKIVLKKWSLPPFDLINKAMNLCRKSPWNALLNWPFYCYAFLAHKTRQSMTKEQQAFFSFLLVDNRTKKKELSEKKLDSFNECKVHRRVNKTKSTWKLTHLCVLIRCVFSYIEFLNQNTVMPEKKQQKNRYEKQTILFGQFCPVLWSNLRSNYRFGLMILEWIVRGSKLLIWNAILKY